MSDSPLLGLPYLAASQAQKHVTHNEALSMLDGLVHLAVASRALAAPPPSPADGMRYLVPASPTGDWAGHMGQMALRMEGAWAFFTPREGWRLWVSDEDTLIIFDGTSWNVFGGGLAANGQVKFPATQNPSADANTLDDYEEGTWTPAMTFNNSSTGVTYAAQGGTYTKIGRVVHIQGIVTLTSNGSGAGQARITGLPFTAGPFYSIGQGNLLAGGSAATNIKPRVEASSTQILLLMPGATVDAGATDANCTDAFSFVFSVTYEI